MKIYTRTGDKGFTSTLRGNRVPKNDCLIQVNGEIDSLQTQLDKVIIFLKKTYLFDKELIQLKRIEFLLWQLGGEISLGSYNKVITKPVEETDIYDLENWIDSFKIELNRFQRFTNIVSIEINEARTRTRNLERTLTDYLKKNNIRADIYAWINRLSDYFFALAVYVERSGNELKGEIKNEK